MNPTDESAFDDALRTRLTDAVSSRPLPAGGMADVRARLAAASPTVAPRNAGRGRSFGAGVVVGLLLLLTGWWSSSLLPTTPATSASPAVPAPPLRASPAAPRSSAGPSRKMRVAVATIPDSPATIPDLQGTTASSASFPKVLEADSARTARSLRPVAAESVPLAPQWVRAIALDTALRQALAQPMADTTRATREARRARVQALIQQQTAALAALQTAFDSLKASLPETPPSLAQATLPADSVAPPTEAWRHLPPARSPWALVALLETTPSWSTLPVRRPTADQEYTQASLSQSAQVQRQLGSHWLVRAGFGQTATQTQTHRTSERNGEVTRRDSVLTTDVIVRETHSASQITHIIDSLMYLEPVTNLSGQIIGYDTSWTYITETITSIITGHDTLRTARTVVTARTETWREARQQLFRPTYRFWTVPLAVQYQLWHAPRWGVGVNLGGQLSFFRGGERPVLTTDGYAMRRVRAREAGFRPVSFSVSAGLEATYRLSPRLSALVAPTARWWAVPTARGATTQRLLPALQVGLTLGL